MANEEQIEYWNDKAGPEWVAEQARLDQTVAVHGELVLERAGIEAGQAVLDVGCGTGQTTVAAALQAAPGGTVQGVDISRVMLEAARERAREAGAEATFSEGDAQTYSFADATYDHVISRFGVMFFDEPSVAFANLRRATRPGGHLTFVCWQPLAKNPWVALPARALSEVVPLPPRDPDEPGPFAFADPEKVRALLAKAGWSDIELESVERTSNFGDGSVEDALDFLLTIGPVASALRSLEDDELRQRGTAAVRAAIEGHATGGKVAFGNATWLVRATNA